MAALRERDFKIPAWPFVSHTSNSEYSSTDILWPFIHHERSGRKSKFRFRPFLFWYDGDRQENTLSVGILFYMIFYRRMQSAISWLVLPLLMYSYVNAVLAQTQTIILGGLIWYNKKREHFRYVHVLPLFFQYRRYALDHNADNNNTYKISREFFTILGIYWRWISPKRYFAWALLYLHYSAGELSLTHFWPFFGHQSKKYKYNEYSSLYPLFRVRINHQIHSKTFHFPWPLFKFATKFDYNSIRILPILWIKRGWDHSSGFVLLYHWNYSLNHISRGIFPFIYWRKGLSPGTEHLSTWIVFPFYINHKGSSGTLLMLSPFYWRWWGESRIIRIIFPFYISILFDSKRIVISPILALWYQHSFAEESITLSILFLFWVHRSYLVSLVYLLPLGAIYKNSLNAYRFGVIIIPLATWFRYQKNPVLWKYTFGNLFLASWIKVSQRVHRKIHTKVHLLWPLYSFRRTRFIKRIRLFPFVFYSANQHSYRLIVLPFLYQFVRKKERDDFTLLFFPILLRRRVLQQDLFIGPLASYIDYSQDFKKPTERRLTVLLFGLITWWNERRNNSFKLLIFPLLYLSKRNGHLDRLFACLAGLPPYIYYRQRVNQIRFIFWPFWGKIEKGKEGVPRDQWGLRYYILWPLIGITRRRLNKSQSGAAVFLLFYYSTDKQTKEQAYQIFWLGPLSIFTYHYRRSFESNTSEAHIKYHRFIAFWPLFRWSAIDQTPLTNVEMRDTNNAEDAENAEGAGNNDNTQNTTTPYVWNKTSLIGKFKYSAYLGNDPDIKESQKLERKFSLFYIYGLLGWMSFIWSPDFCRYLVFPFYYHKHNRDSLQSEFSVSSVTCWLWLLPQISFIKWKRQVAKQDQSILLHRSISPFLLERKIISADGNSKESEFGLFYLWSASLALIHRSHKDQRHTFFIFPIVYRSYEDREMNNCHIFSLFWLFHPSAALFRQQSTDKTFLRYLFPLIMYRSQRSTRDASSLEHWELGILNFFTTPISLFHVMYWMSRSDWIIYLYPIFYWRSRQSLSSFSRNPVHKTLLLAWITPSISLFTYNLRDVRSSIYLVPLYARIRKFHRTPGEGTDSHGIISLIHPKLSLIMVKRTFQGNKLGVKGWLACVFYIKRRLRLQNSLRKMDTECSLFYFFSPFLALFYFNNSQEKDQENSNNNDSNLDQRQLHIHLFPLFWRKRKILQQDTVSDSWSILWPLFPRLALGSYRFKMPCESGDGYQTTFYLFPLFRRDTYSTGLGHSPLNSRQLAFGWIWSSRVSLAYLSSYGTDISREDTLSIMFITSLRRYCNSDGTRKDLKLGILSIIHPYFSLIHYRNEKNPAVGIFTKAYCFPLFFVDRHSEEDSKKIRISFLYLVHPLASFAHLCLNGNTTWGFIFPFIYASKTSSSSTKTKYIKLFFVPAPDRYPIALGYWKQTSDYFASYLLPLFYYWRDNRNDEQCWSLQFLWIIYWKWALISIWRYRTIGAHERRRIYKGLYMLLIIRLRQVIWLNASEDVQEEEENVLSLIWIFQRRVCLFFYDYSTNHANEDAKKKMYLACIFFYEQSQQIFRFSIIYIILRQLAIFRISRVYTDRTTKVSVFPAFKYRHIAGNSTEWAFLTFVPVRYSFIACVVSYKKEVLERGRTRSVVLGGQTVEKEDKSARKENRHFRVLYRVFQWKLENGITTVEFNPLYFSEKYPDDDFEECLLCGGCIGKRMDHGNQQCRLCCCCFV
eukprot:gb/GECH01000008.1/.p1 GENE.gb/GECH01000008.1/~~gb/GECH01000008.1/.p1  ORF type:complete len:1713 (+),score=167.12 gb/GECH01000008.1/:1-5139(+)